MTTEGGAETKRGVGFDIQSDKFGVEESPAPLVSEPIVEETTPKESDVDPILPEPSFETVLALHSYQIKPDLQDKFKANPVKEVIRTVLTETLTGKTYDSENAKKWTIQIANDVNTKVRELKMKRYKHIAQVIIGELKGAGVKCGVRCVWDSETDGYTSDVFMNVCIVKRKDKSSIMTEDIQRKLQTELDTLKNIQKDYQTAISMKQKLDGQINENQLVKGELDLLPDDAVVYKSVGPVLIKTELAEAKRNVTKRLDFINKEMQRVNDRIRTSEKKQDTHREALQKLQHQFQQAQVKAAMKA